MRIRLHLVLLVTSLCLADSTRVAGAPPPLGAPTNDILTLVAHWAEYEKPDYVKFIADAQPDIAQVGFYGAHFWSLGHTPQYGGYPANFPVRGLNELGDWFEKLNRDIHQHGTKVVGHFNVEFLIGDLDGTNGPRGFFKFYRELWDEKRLGPKPVADPIQLLERDARGAPITNRSYSIGGMTEYWACLRNPAWQQVLKVWVKEGLRRGVDGFVSNYFYRHNCLCEHCQSAFRRYLSKRYTAAELRSRFGIDDLEKHVFTEIVSWHPAAETTPLRLEMLRFSQISNKEVFDEVFVRYGRSLKPDLIVAQWNHLGNLSQIDGDERCLLPAELWGRDETYLWYSTGDAANNSDLAKGVLGEGTLQARYIRGAFEDKPFTLGKYEGTRIRIAMAELAANGGAPMGFYTKFSDPEARAEIVRYYQFLRRNAGIYRRNRPAGEVALLFPRREVHRGNVSAVERFRRLGQALLDEHVLFDVWPDDIFKGAGAEGYRTVVTTSETPEKVKDALSGGRARFEAPLTVRVSASRPDGRGDEIDLHFVNYNRTEPPRGANGRPAPGRGIQDEQPIPVTSVGVDFPLPAGVKLKSVELLTPEGEDSRSIEARVEDGRVRFSLPKFLVYGVARLRF